MLQYLKPADFATASIPVLANLTLGDWNSLVGIIATLAGLAYLVWKWRKEARKDE